jgi:hypothetical protein
MTRARLLALAAARYGNVEVEVDRGAPVGERRRELTEQLRAHRAAKPPLAGQLGRHTLQECRAITDARRAWLNEEDRLMDLLLRYRFELLQPMRIPGISARCQIGYGDTWDEVAERAGLLKPAEAAK